MKTTCAALAISLLATMPAAAVDFTGWTEQRFSVFSSNDYTQAGQQLGVRSDGTVSLLWTRLPDAARDTTAASWRWSVSRSVPPTALDRKGGDDRNLSLYFVFLPPATATALDGRGIRALLDADGARVLMYVWGGQAGRGSVLASPYLGARGRTVVLRPAGTGAHAEQVDLRADLRRAFGAAGERVLVGLAVSADSDDTESAITAAIADLQLR